MKKATIESLIADKTSGRYDKKNTKVVELPSLGFSLELVNPSLSKMLNTIDMMGDVQSTSEGIKFMVNIVYDACPMLHNKELREAFDCVEPTDIVLKVLHDDIGALQTLSEAVMSFFGLGELDDVLKN